MSRVPHPIARPTRASAIADARRIVCLRFGRHRRHAGYSYSGKTAAFGYVDVDPDAVETVFLLGPSHHVYLEGCALSKASVYRTPVGDITVDVDLCNELAGSGKFKRMSIDVDQDEHSLEMVSW